MEYLNIFQWRKSAKVDLCHRYPSALYSLIRKVFELLDVIEGRFRYCILNCNEMVRQDRRDDDNEI